MLKSLVFIRMKSMFTGFMGRSKKKAGPGKIALFVVLVAYIIVVFGGLFINLFSSMYDAFTAIGLEWLYFGFIGLMVFILCFVGSVFVTQQQLFEAKDNDLLLSMPVPVRNILISRLLSILLLNYIFEILVIGPGLGVYLFKGQVNPAGLAFSLAAFLLLPALVLSVSALFGWIIAFIDSKIGRKNLIMMVLTLLLLLVYMYVCFRMQHYMTKLIENGEAIGSAIEKALPPFYYLGKACAEADAGALGIFVLFCAVPFAAVYFALSKSFIKIATADKGRKKAVYREQKLKTSGVKTALFLKDLRHFTGSPMYIFNCGIGLLFMLIGAGYVFVKADDLKSVEQMLQMMTGDEQIMGAALCAGLAMMASLTDISAPMISIEAKTLWISRSLPVSAKDVLFAKANVHIYCSLPFIIVSALLLQVSFDMSLLSRALLVGLPVAVTVFNAYMGIVLNLAYPKFDWVNEVDAMKQGAAPLLAVLIAMATVAMPALLYVLLLGEMMAAEIYVLIVFLLFVLACAALNRYIAAKGVKQFEAL